MKISEENFLKNDAALKIKLKDLNRREGGVFIDGPFNASKYYKSNLKILWVLKEPYGDPFDYTDFFVNKFEQFFKDLIDGIPRYTWGTIARISNNILNDYHIETKLPNIWTLKKQIQESLANIAFININKDSSDTGGRSVTGNVEKAREYYENFLDRQIDHIKPDVVICGNTFQFLRKKYDYPQVIKSKNNIDYVDHYRIDNTLFLDPYHPAYLAYGKIDELSYVNDIVRTVRDCY